MNRRQQPSSRSSSSSSSAAKSSDIARPISASKTMSKRAQRRVQQLVDLEEDAAAAAAKNPTINTHLPVKVWPVVQRRDNDGKPLPTKKPPRRVKDQVQYRRAMDIERERRITPSNATVGSGDSDDGSDEKKSKKELLTETMTKADDDTADEANTITNEHERIEELIHGYSNRVAQLNDLSRNAPSMDGIHEWNARAVRKQAGAIRYHNKITGSILKTARQQDNRVGRSGEDSQADFHTSNSGYTSRAAALAQAVTKTIDDSMPLSHGGRFIIRRAHCTEVERFTNLRKNLEQPQVMMRDMAQMMSRDNTRKGHTPDAHGKRRTHVRSLLQHGDLHGVESMGGGSANVFSHSHYSGITVRKMHAPQVDLS